MERHCAFQPKAYWNDYWGNPAHDWQVVYWWHDGNKCYGDARFRGNFLSDGRIQSVANTNLYLGTDSLGKDAFVKWYNNGDGRVRSWSARGDRLCVAGTDWCLGRWSGQGSVSNNSVVHLRAYSEATPMTIY